MKTATLIIIRKLSIIITLLFLSTLLNAQVKIRDTVKISPRSFKGASPNDYGQILEGYVLPYNAEVWIGDPLVRAPSDTESWTIQCNDRSVTISPYENPGDPSQDGWVGGSYGVFPRGTTLTFSRLYPADSVEPRYVVDGVSFPYTWPDSCGGSFFLWMYNPRSPARWIQCEDLITISRVEFLPPVSISTFAFINALSYPDWTSIPLRLMDTCGHYESSPPTPVTYNLEITHGAEWGSLKNDETGQVGTSIQLSAANSCATCRYFADAQQSCIDQQVSIDVTCNDPTFRPLTIPLTITGTPCLKLEVTKDKIEPGDTVVIIPDFHDCEGNVTTYPANQKMYIWINSRRYGLLRCIATGQKGIFLYGLPPFEFIATSDMFEDSVTVNIYTMQSSTGGGGVSSVAVNKKEKTPVTTKSLSEKSSIIKLNTSKEQKSVDEVSMDEIEKRAEAIEKRYNEAPMKKKDLASRNITQKETILSTTSGNICDPPTAGVMIKKKEAVLIATPAVIFRGDTASLEVKKLLSDGSLESFPADQAIDIWMNTDDSYGKFRSVPTGEEGTEINTQQPFQFIAADSIDADTVAVEIQAWADGEYIMPIAHLLVIKRTSCIQTKFVKAPLSIGDTTLLTFVNVETGKPVPMSTYLDVAIMNADGTNGWLLPSSGGPNTTLDSVTQPIKYIAPDSIKGDSLIVYIKAVESETNSITGLNASTQLIGISPKPLGANALNSGSQIENKVTQKIQGPNGRTIQPQSLSRAMIKALTEQACPIDDAGIVMGLDHFDVEIVPDTAAAEDIVAFTEGAKLIIQAKDKENKEVKLDAKTKIKFSLQTNEEYGTFINANGDTLKSTPVQLFDVQYADAKDGKVKFAAVKKNPETSVKCNIRVELQSDPKKYGERDAVVVEQTLRIVMVGLREVRPLIPNEIRIVIPGEPTATTSFNVLLTRGGQSVADHPFELSSNYIDKSGGHDHTLPRRVTYPDTIKFQNYGLFNLVGADPIQAGQPLTGKTIAGDGVLYMYQASIFGDAMRIRLNSLKKPLLKDSVDIVEKVSVLELLPDGSNYIKVGGTCEHHGLSDNLSSTSPCQTPDNNHWGTPILIRNIRTIADSFADEYPNYRLRINDMSLPLGGKFDLDASWRDDTSHQEHRIGINADINLDAYKNGIKVILNEEQTDELWYLIRRVVGREPLDESDINHYHVQ